MKSCNICRKEKEDSDFYKDKSRPTGLMARCIECDRLFRKASRARNPNTHKARGKRYYKAHKQGKLEYLKKWRAKNWFKSNAHVAVRNALRAGILKKMPCDCGNEDAEAHHDDYTKPLEVRWLCHWCHMTHHHGK